MMETLTHTFRSDPALQALFGFAAGTLLGFLHFGALWWNTRAFATGAAVRAVVLHILRFAVLIAVLYGLAKLGALVLLTAAVGIFVARSLVLRRVRSVE